jgi:hypothetical protein
VLLRGDHVSALLAVAPGAELVRRHVVLSRRAVPVWRERCGDPGEPCDESFAIGDAPAGFRGLSMYNAPDNFVPFALARRGAEGIEVTPVDRPRAWALEDLIAAAIPPPVDWLADADARRLYEEVCADTASDHPRHVLADYLLEREYGHGIVIAFGLSRTLDDDAYQRHESLLRENGPRWLGPLLPIIPAAGAFFRRGFLWRAEICAPERHTLEAIRGTPALGTVEQLRVIQPSPGFDLDRSMVSLREVTVLGPQSAATLADNPAPWAIERLGIDVARSGIDRLVAAKLPALQLLEIGGELASIERLQEASWWPALQLLVLVVELPEVWFARAQALARYRPGTHRGPTVAVNAHRRGWQFAFTPRGEVRVMMRDFDAQASRSVLRDLVARHFAGRDVELEPSPCFAPAPGDLG